MKAPLQTPGDGQKNDHGGKHAFRGEQGSEGRVNLGRHPATEGGRGRKSVLAADLLKVVLLLLLVVIFDRMIDIGFVILFFFFRRGGRPAGEEEAAGAVGHAAEDRRR